MKLFAIATFLIASFLNFGPAVEIGPFVEPEVPFFASALVIPDESGPNRVRRGVLVSLGADWWACFDSDLLRWAAAWKAPAGKPPLTLDSMAAISYPDGKAKAKSPPQLQGELIFSSQELTGEGRQNPKRARLLNKGSKQVGPLDPQRGRWLGVEMRSGNVILRYRVGDATVEEFLTRDDGNEGPNLCRVLRVSPHLKPLDFRVHSAFKHHRGGGKMSSDGFLSLKSSRTTSTFVLGTKSAPEREFPLRVDAMPVFPESFEVENPASLDRPPYRIRPLAMPESSRYIRPTDLAFLSDGTGLLSTLDGDIWRIENPGKSVSRWTRIAFGLFETISVETTPDDRIFTLGRDQITELIDTNGDHHIDCYRNASNVFQQTLQSRDYATSLAIDKDGSFLIAKGGIHNQKARKDNELSGHRGTILRISPDGDSVKVLADGLRLPYVGLRKDGAVFASDQQGHYIPSTPLHLIEEGRPFLGFAPTNFRKRKPVPPLLYYPYQVNRSAAAFASWKDLFLQVSWGGRLFAIETPERGQPFSWQLPLQLDFPSLNATVHPVTGRLYVTGLGISGYKPTTPNLLGIASIEEVVPFPKPISMEIKREAIVLTFNRPLKDDEILIPASPTLRLFDVKRTSKYGSGHFRWDGRAGEFRTQPKAFGLSEDRRTFTLEFDQVFRAGLLDLALTLTAGETMIPLHFFARPDHLDPPDLAKLEALKDKEPELVSGRAAMGKPLFLSYACAGCHSLDGAKLVGPSLQGVGLRTDKDFLRQSILAPNAVITKGYPAAMPSFAGMLTDQELEDLLAYLLSLR